VNKTTALYARVSTLDQRQDSQLKELKNYCRLRKWTNLTVYKDNVSGAKLARPDLDRLMRDVRAARVDRVVCYKLDRLGRSVAHLALLMEELINLHVPLIVTTQGIDTSEDNAVGRLQAHVIMAMAEFERSLIRERVRSGLAAARERGVRLGRKPMLVKRVEEVRRLKKAGLGIRAISRELGMPPSSVYKVYKLAS
jgi:putative DNA-invertase from lambdoid prophage Rac